MSPLAKKRSKVLAQLEQRMQKFLEFLRQHYPDLKPHLRAESPWQLLVATMLSAQCTDDRVNMVTPELFRHWPCPEQAALAEISELEECIRSVGFFHNKAKNIKACAERILSEFQGNVPRSLAALVQLPGVGRKTANVVLWGAYGINSGVAIDTHVARISHRLEFTSSLEPGKAEQELMKLLPQAEWGAYNHRLVSFGREFCKARKPECQICPMFGFCPWDRSKENSSS